MMRHTKLMATLVAMIAVSACVTGNNDDKKPVSSPAKINDFRAYVAKVCPNDPDQRSDHLTSMRGDFMHFARRYSASLKSEFNAVTTAEDLHKQRRTVAGSGSVEVDNKIKDQTAAATNAARISASFQRQTSQMSLSGIGADVDIIQSLADSIRIDLIVLGERVAARNVEEETALRFGERTAERRVALGNLKEPDDKIGAALKNIDLRIQALDGSLNAVAPTLAPVALTLIAAVLPSLIDASLDLVSSALHEAAKDSSTVHTATTTAYLHTAPKPEKATTAPILANTLEFGCIILTKGEFAGAVSDPADDYIHIEAKVERSNDRAAFRLVPIYARLNNYKNTGALGGGTPEIAVSVALHAARAGKESAPIALTMFALPIVKAGSELKRAHLQGRESYWTAYPAPDTTAKARLERLTAAQKRVSEATAAKTVADCDAQINDLWAHIPKLDSWKLDQLKSCAEAQETVLRAILETLAKKDTAPDAARYAAAATIADLKKRAMAAKETADELDDRTKTYLGAFEPEIKLTPVSIEVQLIESRKGSPFLQAVANALDKSKKDISAALVQELSPVERAKRRAEEEQQTRTNRAAVATAEDNVRLKQAELDDLPATATRAERVRAENALRQAKIAANNAYLADGRGVPYPEAQP